VVQGLTEFTPRGIIFRSAKPQILRISDCKLRDIPQQLRPSENEPVAWMIRA
jgi:hypothetical protein